MSTPTATLSAFAAEAAPSLTNGVTMPLNLDDMTTMIDALKLMAALTIDDDERERANTLIYNLTTVTLVLKLEKNR